MARFGQHDDVGLLVDDEVGDALDAGGVAEGIPREHGDLGGRPGRKRLVAEPARRQHGHVDARENHGDQGECGEKAPSPRPQHGDKGEREGAEEG